MDFATFLHPHFLSKRLSNSYEIAESWSLPKCITLVDLEKCCKIIWGMKQKRGTPCLFSGKKATPHPPTLLVFCFSRKAGGCRWRVFRVRITMISPPLNYCRERTKRAAKLSGRAPSDTIISSLDLSDHKTQASWEKLDSKFVSDKMF